MENKQNSISTPGFTQLPVGFEFPTTILKLTKSHISKYLEAVDDSIDFLTSGFIPPLMLAACANTALSKSFIAPAGTIHVSQDFEFFKVVSIGESVKCCGIIAQKVNRGNLHFIVVNINILNHNGEKVLSGKATITVPN